MLAALPGDLLGPLVVVVGLGVWEGESGPWLGGFPMWLRLGEGSGETLALRVPA
jgi:hypothetical protein